MTAFDDDQDVWRIPDEELLRGEPVAGEAELTEFVAALRRTADGPVPTPSPALAALLGQAGPGTAPLRAGSRRTRPPGRRPVRRAARYVAGAGLTLKLTVGAGLAAAAVTGAATVDAVPDVVQRPAAALLQAVTGLVRPDDAPAPGGAPGPAATHGRDGSVPPTRTEEPEPAHPSGTGGEKPRGDRPGGRPSERPALPETADDTARERRGTGSTDRPQRPDHPTGRPTSRPEPPGRTGQGDGDGGGDADRPARSDGSREPEGANRGSSSSGDHRGS